MAEFRRLSVWQRAHDLTVEVYRATQGFPPHEAFALTRQLRRAAVSVPANLAEGRGRRSDRELARFATIARGSLHELQYLVYLSRDLGYLSSAEWEALDRRIEKIGSQLWGLISHLRSPHLPSP